MKYRVLDETGATRGEGDIADSGLAALLRDCPQNWKVITSAGEDADIVKRLDELTAAFQAQKASRRGVTFVIDLGLDRALDKLLSKMGDDKPNSDDKPPNFAGGMGWKPKG